VDHEQAERLISERLDGERIAPRAVLALERHLEGCAECRAFERGAYRLREAARFEIAPAIPDLVEPIMAAVEGKAGATRPGLRVVRPMRLPRRRLLPRLAPAVAALLLGALVGSLVVGGPWSEEARRSPSALAAEDVSRGVAEAAATLTAYEATFAITERHWSDDVPTRLLSMHVWFRAPERFRLEVEDQTAYRTRATPTDLELIVDRDTWYSAGPSACPTSPCPQRETSFRNRVPFSFSSAAPAPTDLVLPITALAEPAAIRVVGRDTVLGRLAVVVEVPFERAASLFPFLSLGGDWRPFFSGDRVRIWLDRDSWFPLRWIVYPAAGRERNQWELRFGLPDEAPGDPVFEVDARSVGLAPPPLGVFAIPSTVEPEDRGARTVAVGDLAAELGFEPVRPTQLRGLDLYRAVIPATPDAGEAIVTYADGLSFLKLAESRSWAGDAPFGSVDVRAEEVPLGTGVAYYEPAGAEHGRRLSIHAAGTDLLLESNLPREELLAVAETLPVVGLRMPDDWRVRASGGLLVERVTLAEASAAIGTEIAVPRSLPSGVVLASVELVRAEGPPGATLFFRDTEAGAAMIRLHVETATELPPASSGVQRRVEVDDAPGRWTPSRGLLEWLDAGVYRSLDASGLALSELLAIAASIPSAGGA
jgi:outer membrane lipoprotein-sorting protein